MTITPLEYNVVLRQEPIPDKTPNGLFVPEATREKQRFDETRATIVAVSPMAFAFDDWPEGAVKPKPGDRVMFARHAGVFTKDGEDEIRVVKDRDIVAVLS